MHRHTFGVRMKEKNTIRIFEITELEHEQNSHSVLFFPENYFVRELRGQLTFSFDTVSSDQLWLHKINFLLYYFFYQRASIDQCVKFKVFQ